MMIGGSQGYIPEYQPSFVARMIFPFFSRPSIYVSSQYMLVFYGHTIREKIAKRFLENHSYPFHTKLKLNVDTCLILPTLPPIFCSVTFLRKMGVSQRGQIYRKDSLKRF